MSQCSPFLRKTADGYAHFCPACQHTHAIAVDRPFKNGARWGFNGNVNAPSFAPSVNISATDDETGEVIYRCHYFLKLGADCGSEFLADKPYLQFLADCTHALKGKTVPLPELPTGYGDVVEF